MSTYYYQKPQQQPARQSNGKVLWLSCQYTNYTPGEGTYLCGAETDNHAQYCKLCAPKVLPITSNRRDTIRTYID